MKPATRIISAHSAALIGMTGLAVAMGIGRFATTPLLPLMQRDAGVSIAAGGWLATANYIGYLVGALVCIAMAPRPAASIRWGLVFVAIFTLAMASIRFEPLWIAFRFMAGVASAMVLVGVSAWAMPHLKRHGRETWAGHVFAGVGIGIALTGVLCLGAGIGGWRSQSAWLVLGSIAALLVVLLWRPLTRDDTVGGPAPASRQPLGRSVWIAAACYGAFGYGYIIPATFLPAVARAYIDNPAVFGLVWPVFGLAAATSTLVAATRARHVSPRRLWVFAQWFLLAGVVAPLLAVNVATLIIAAVCVGGSFMVITMAGIKEALRLGGTQGPRAVGVMTAAFAIGQIAGPVTVNLFRQASGFPMVPSLIAAAALVASSCILIGTDVQGLDS